MYCLEKLQRELAYFFDMDLRELPRVQDLLKQKGYTQIQKGDEIITLESSTPKQKTPYTDTQGHTHQIPTDIAQKWLESFGLKDLQESYTPKFSEQVAQALEPILQGDQINLSANSLVKLIQRDRAEFLPYIKETLEIPNAVVRQVDGAIIFAKDYRDEKLGKFFASVSKNDNGEWVISSNAPKNLNNLQNKIKEGGEVLYSDLPELPIIAKPELPAKALNSEANLSDIIPQAPQEKPKWSKADQKAWKAAKLAETRAKAQELQAKLQPIYDEVRPLVIQARKLEKPYKEEGKKLPPKVEKQVNELLAKVSESITPKQKPFEAELEKHGLQLNRTDFLHYPESGSIQVTPKQNSNLEWKNKERGDHGLKGSAKYREQALEKLSEKSYIDRLEPATKAANPLTQLHGLKYEILKDLHKAKRYAKQGGTSYETYTRYASRASDELDIIEQAIRELKNAIVPKPKRVEQVRSKVQDFIKWRDEVRFDVDYLLGLESDGTRHALEYLRDLPTPTKHHASFVKDLQEQIHKHFDTDPTPPTPPSTPTPTDTQKADSSLTTPKQKTIEKIDSYASTPEFKTLSTDKQEAILSLKTIEPSPMPQEITQENLENLFRHFNSKQDKAQREFYAKLFNDTKENPHITLEVKRDNETRQEYIKAYQHKDTHDLYYIAITKENDTIKVTGYPITKIKDVINQIKNAEKVVWRHQGDLTHTALDSKKSPNLESAESIIPQMPKDNSDPVKTFEYFKDDFIKEYPKALEFYDGHIPMASELSYRVELSVQNEIEAIKEAMNNTAKDKFEKLLKNIGLKQNEIAQVLDTTIRSDIDYTLWRVKDFLDYVARNLNNFTQEHKPIAQEILAHSQEILNMFENKPPQIEQLQKKRELISRFHDNARMSDTKEQDLLKGLLAKLYKPQSKQAKEALESTPKAKEPTQKGLFDEADSSVEATQPSPKSEPAQPSSRGSEATEAIHKEAPQDTPKVDSTQNTQSVATPQAEAVEMRNRGFQGAGEEIYLGDNEQARAVESTIYRSNATPQTQAREIPEQDLPHHAEKELYKELESLKPLKRELTQLRESGEWRSKQGRARRKELDEKIKEAEARGITSTQIQTANAKNYEKFLSKYGDMEYFKELAQESRDKYIQGLQKDIDNYDASKTAPTPNGIIFTKQSLENILESTREQELDIAGQIWSIADSMAKLREGAIYKQTDEKIGEFYTKERGKIQKALGIKPIAEFGENYAEYYRDGVGAIEKLLAEKKGQVAGAFHREELGDIDLVWGEVTGSGKEAKGYGLAKIIEKHGDEFQDIAKELDEIIRDGKVVKTHNGYNITLGDYKVGLNIGWNENGIKIGENKWVVTAFDNSKLQSEKQGSNSASLTKGETLPLNSSDIIPQSTQTPPTQKGLFDEVDSSVESTPPSPKSEPAQPSSRADEIGAAIHKEAPTKPKDTPTQEIPEKKTLQTFEQAIARAGRDTRAKIQIAKEHLEYILKPLQEQAEPLKELIKTKNFDGDEIAEALQRIETTAKPHAKKRGNIFVPFVDKPSTGWLISDKLPPLEQAKTLLAWELERKNRRFFTKVSDIGGKIRSLERFKEALEQDRVQEWHFTALDSDLDFIAKELKKHDLAEKDAKSYDMTYTQARDLFYKGLPTQIQTELFEKVLPVAQKLGVNIRSAVRFRYENAGSDFTKDIAGMYRTNPNAATLKKGIPQDTKHEVLLHELIHSVTSRAIYAYDRGQLDLLTTPQQNAIKSIKEIYAELFSKRDELGLKRWQDKEMIGDYGLKNEHEMLAELANPSFVEKLKNIGIFEKLVDNIIKLIASAKEIFGLKKTNAYERLKAELENIITNYKDDFSTQWEAQKFRDRAMGSEKVDSSASSFTYTTGEAKSIAELRKDLKQALEPSLNKEIVNKEQGLSGVITTEEVKKIMSKKAVAKSVANGFSRDEHIEVAKHIERLFTESKLLRSHKDYKENPNILQVHRFIKDIEVNGKEANALITLFEKMQGKNKIYTIELESLESTPLSTQAKSAEVAVKAQSAAATPTEAAPIAKTDGESIAQDLQETPKVDSNALLKSAMKKFAYDEKKAKDLLEWHKDSSPLTKDENGLPKVFYHGTQWKEIGNKIFEVFDTKYSNQVDKFLQGHYFSSSKKIARTYNANIYEVFLNAKNPLVIDFKGHTFNDYIDDAIDSIPKHIQENIRDFHDSIIFKNIIDDSTQNGKKHPVADTIMVLDSNQIKHIENRGIESESGRKYFNSSSPNIFHSNPHLGAGLLGGSVAGIEQDENGQWRFSPEKFALGLLGGAAGSIAISKAHKKFLQSKPQKIIPFINKQKSIPPRFEVTKELEKTYRNAQVKPNEKIKDTLGLSGAIKGDFIKLAQKHPEYFANPQQAKDLCDYVFQNAFIGLQASDKKQALIIAKLQDSSNDYGSVAFRVQNINSEHRIRSVMLMEQKQVDIKVENAKKLGEPIFHFW